MLCRPEQVLHAGRVAGLQPQLMGLCLRIGGNLVQPGQHAQSPQIAALGLLHARMCLSRSLAIGRWPMRLALLHSFPLCHSFEIP